MMIVALVLLGLGPHAFAGCTCSMPGGDCERGWSSGQVIFLGKVTADIATEAPVVEDLEEANAEVLFPGAVEKLPMNHAVHFSIAESFRGEGQLGQETVVQTGVDERGPRDGDCSYPFVVGVSYLSKCFIGCRLGTRGPFFLSLSCTEFLPNSQSTQC